MGSILVNHSVTVGTVLLAWRLYLPTFHVLVEGLQYRHPFRVGPLPLHANILAQFLSLVATNLLIAAILETALLVQSPLRRSALVGMWFFATFLVGQRI